MAVALSLRKAAGASILFKLLSSKSQFSSTASPSITRFFSSDSKKQKKSSKPSAPQEFKMENPFQSAGPNELLKVNTFEDGLLVRVAMPGVSEDGIKVWLENNRLYFNGEGEIELETEDSARKYGGSLKFSTDFCKAEKVEAQMNNGILRIVVKGKMRQD